MRDGLKYYIGIKKKKNLGQFSSEKRLARKVETHVEALSGTVD